MPFNILLVHSVVTYRNTGVDTNDIILQNSNAVCFRHFQGEYYNFGELLLVIRHVRKNSEKRLASTGLSVRIYQRGSHWKDFCEI